MKNSTETISVVYEVFIELLYADADYLQNAGENAGRAKSWVRYRGGLFGNA